MAIKIFMINALSGKRILHYFHDNYCEMNDIILINMFSNIFKLI